MKDLRYNRPFSYGIGVDLKEVTRIDWKKTDFLINNSVRNWDYMSVQIDADNKFGKQILSGVVTIFSHRRDEDTTPCINWLNSICLNAKTYHGIDFETKVSLRGKETLLETDEFVIAVPNARLCIPGLCEKVGAVSNIAIL